MTRRGRLVVFEGLDGCGKSTQTRRVATALGALATYEPGDTDLGAALRQVVLHARLPITPMAEVLVMAADRAQHVVEVIEPALAEGRDVVCDRFNGSTLAYQGYGRGLDVDALRGVLAVATGGVEPDCTVLLDCPADVARARRSEATPDRFEGADGAFASRVRDGFLELAAASPTWWVVAADRSRREVDRDVDAALREVLG